ncbi:hypothetical protein FA09DRAFT_332919 [Tilletiopsis washingtonensis]|uniref:Secreted protein n=1 Tax=Tilletiopsis washingtonensis TaxID=58919 RepID=A0A316YZE7_9BASI|nr:hypothetical protein FA09DRAFT_332919 [Tilletiopsis washingtonensis]PWN94512.1 hypothetical protein FA09DRAFT_332919 [Tilletiopsis washingtonensis]
MKQLVLACCLHALSDLLRLACCPPSPLPTLVGSTKSMPTARPLSSPASVACAPRIRLPLVRKRVIHFTIPLSTLRLTPRPMPGQRRAAASSRGN